MRSKLSGYALAMFLALGLAAAPASAQPKGKAKTTAAEAGDKGIEKQMAWEQKVMGEDGAKKNDMKKIAAAQKLAEESRKNPPPEAAPKHKDPSKEGVRAKSEASIGLPIESDEAQKSTSKKPVVAKKAAAPKSDNDELGALVASSLAEDKKAAPVDTRAYGGANARAARGRGKAKGKGHAAASKSSPPSSLDAIFAAGK